MPPKRATRRPKAITSLQESSTRGKRNWIIYADSGVGKSCLLATAPNALILTSEVGALEGARELGYNPDEWVTDTYDKFLEAYDWLEAGGYREYEFLGIDSVTEMEELVWRDEMDANFAINPRRSPFNPALQDYPTVWNRMKEMVNRLNRLPINVIYTATAMRITAEDDEQDEVIPKLMPMIGSPKRGDLSQKFCAKASLVGLLRTGRGKEGEGVIRRLYLEGSKRWIAKSRHPSLGRVVDSPNIVEMLRVIEEGPKSPSKPRRKRAA